MKFPKYLKVAAVNVWPYYIFIDPKNTTEFSGIEGELLKLLAERLKFDYTLHLPTDDQQFGFKDASGNWTGIKGMISREEVDMAIASLGIREEEFYLAEISVPYSDEQKTFTSDLPRPLPKYTVLINPLSLYVWIALVICFTLLPVVFYFLKIHKNHYGNVSNEEKCGRPTKHNPQNIATRILEGFWIVSNTLLGFIYTSAILSVLTVENKGNVIRSFEELAVLLDSRKYKCMLLKGNVVSNILIRSNLKHLRNIGSVIKSYHDTYIPSEYQMKPFGENRVVLGSKLLFQIMHGSTKYISDHSFEVVSVGIFLKKGFCCMNRLNTVLLRIASAGLYEKIIRDVAFKQEERISSSFNHTTGVMNLDLNALSGIFFVLLMGYFTSLVLLLLEIVYNRWQRKENNFK
ncbi:hypothetical protein AVEN_215763-1 [Araneus ventricosus]|uniref:Ionotropic glutamate receptor L-glutamate and glycine-binding domain-containing protein n=1 Tax=Araneus ventricosus TaxID=182803 RepID=A0A4Y2JNE8_ARAVE|nr:hypothetical protein AVEN_215763-1 [Araneus ventricosus]